jgi:TatA/E family protein of Tat protein translocase
MIGSQDLVVGLVIVLVLFGAKRLPELAASLGKSMREFKKGVSARRMSETTGNGCFLRGRPAYLAFRDASRWYGGRAGAAAVAFPRPLGPGSSDRRHEKVPRSREPSRACE